MYRRRLGGGSRPTDEPVTKMAEKDRHERDRIGDEGYEVEVIAKLTGLTRLKFSD